MTVWTLVIIEENEDPYRTRGICACDTRETAIAILATELRHFVADEGLDGIDTSDADRLVEDWDPDFGMSWELERTTLNVNDVAR